MFQRTVGITIFSTLAMTVMFTLLSGCSTEGNNPNTEELMSTKSRVMSPEVSATALAALVEGNSAFAFDLYSELIKGTQGNVFCSPFSISIALAMTFAGARTTTEQAMADTLHSTLGQDVFHPAFNKLDQVLTSREQPPNKNADDGFKLRIANSIWGQKGYAFQASFLDVLAENYGAGLRLLDYGADPEACRLIINDWVADRTENRIKDLIPAGAIDDSTRLVLTNAIYFKAAWNTPFAKESTTSGEFEKLDGSAVAVEMMRKEEDCLYAAGDVYEAVELPYDGELLSMLVIVPTAGEFANFEASLSADRVEAIIDALDRKSVTLSMPKFGYKFSVGLKEALSNLGMAEAFSFASDFTGMTTVEEVLISDVIHEAFVAVNEEGTEAAAATAVIVIGTGTPDHVTLTVDRPFIFLIRDNPTGTVLFVGRVVDPRK